MTHRAHRPASRVTADDGLIIVGCSRRKLVTCAPIPALELYQGALVPHLREHLAAADLAYRSRIRILSAEYGLLHPDDLISTYDHQLTTRAEAERLRERVSPRLNADLGTPALAHVLVVLDSLYLLAAGRLFDYTPPLRLSIILDPSDWTSTATILTRWRWL